LRDGEYELSVKKGVANSGLRDIYADKGKSKKGAKEADAARINQMKDEFNSWARSVRDSFDGKDHVKQPTKNQGSKP